MNGRIIIHIFPSSSSFPIFLGRLGDLGFNVGIHPVFGMYVGFFAGICEFVVSRGLITPGCFGRGVLGGFR